MTKGEIALQLTLAAIEHAQFYVEEATNEGVGKAIVAIYNEISEHIDIRGNANSSATRD